MWFELGIGSKRELINFKYVKEFWINGKNLYVAYVGEAEDINKFEYPQSASALRTYQEVRKVLYNVNKKQTT